jgi:hypothetical protein
MTETLVLEPRPQRIIDHIAETSECSLPGARAANGS